MICSQDDGQPMYQQPLRSCRLSAVSVVRAPQHADAEYMGAHPGPHRSAVLMSLVSCSSRREPGTAAHSLEVIAFAWAAPSFRRPSRSWSIVDQSPLRAWRPRHSLRTGLDLIEICPTLWTDVCRDGPWLTLEITLRIRAYQHYVRSMRRHTISSAASADLGPHSVTRLQWRYTLYKAITLLGQTRPCLHFGHTPWRQLPPTLEGGSTARPPSATGRLC